MSLFAELQRRNVIHMAGLYLAGVWLLVRAASTGLPMFGVAPAMIRGVAIVPAIGFFPALNSEPDCDPLNLNIYTRRAASANRAAHPTGR